MDRVLVGICMALLCIPASQQLKFYRYGYCTKSTPCPNIPTAGLCDDWVLLLSTAASTDNGLVYWGPTYTACDPNTITGFCTNQGMYFLSGDDNTQSTGFSYGYHAELQQWTIERFTVNKISVPGTSSVGYETFYTDYITVKEDVIFQNGKPTACSSTNITINPMLRRSRWVLLDSDQNESYRLILSCENVDGFLYDGYPQVSLYVKRSALDKFKVTECKALSMYKTLADVLAKQKFDIEKLKFQFMVHDKLYGPNDVTFSSVKWDSCTCQVSGTQTSFQSGVYGFY